MKPDDAIIKDFYRQATEVLRQYARPGAKAAGIPPLSICVAEGTSVALAEALRLAAGRILFFLYAPAAGQSAPPAYDTAKVFLSCPLDDAAFFAEKTILLANLLPENIQLHVGRNVQAEHESKINRLHKALQDAAYNYNLGKLRALVQMRNALWNLPAMVERNIGPLPKIRDDSVILLCGAGPSLRQQSAWLRSIAQHAVVVSVGHALPTLLDAQIQPDVIVEGDPYAYRNWPDSLGAQEALLLALPELAPEVVARFKHIHWGQGGVMPLVTLCAQHKIPLTPLALDKTVTIHAMDALIRSGAQTIVLLGQDLCILPSGQAYADESHGEHGCHKDAVLSVPGNDVPFVPTNHNFLIVKQAIEDYIRNRKIETPSLNIMNATSGGARIEGARRVSEQEVEKLLPKTKNTWPPACVCKPLLKDGAPFATAGSDLRKLVAAQEEIAGICRKLSQLLNQYAASPPALARLQCRLQESIQTEERQRRASAMAMWANLVLNQADLVAKPHPALPDINAPAVQLDFLQTRYQFSAQTLAETATLFEHAAHACVKPDLPPPLQSPRMFKAFRQLALARIRANNREYADWLAAQTVSERMENFKLYWCDQFLPRLEFKAPDGWRPFTAFLDMREDANRELNKRLDKAIADPHHAAVVFLCPGNWAHPVFLSYTAPHLPLLVVDPWPELFACLCEHVCFMHTLRPDTLVCGLRHELKKWPQLLQERIHAWVRQGRQIYCFTGEAVANLPQTEAWRQQIATLAPETAHRWI